MFDLEPRDGIVNRPCFEGFSLQCQGLQILFCRQVLLRDFCAVIFGRRMFGRCIEQRALLLDCRWLR